MEKAEDLICVRNILNLIVIELGRPSSWGNGWRLRRLVNVVQNFSNGMAILYEKAEVLVSECALEQIGFHL